MTDPSAYPNMSHSARQGPKKPERPKLEKVIQGEVVKRKKPVGRRIRETFTTDDAQSVGQFVLMDVIVPTVKDLIFEIVTQSLSRTMYGAVGHRAINRLAQGPRAQHTPGFVQYNVMSKPQQAGPGNLRAMAPDGPATSARGQSVHSFDELVFTNRGEADFVLERLMDVLRDYQVVVVSELYDLIGRPSTHADHKWGWFSLMGAGVHQINGGYVLTLPKPVAIDG